MLGLSMQIISDLFLSQMASVCFIVRGPDENSKWIGGEIEESHFYG